MDNIISIKNQEQNQEQSFMAEAMKSAHRARSVSSESPLSCSSSFSKSWTSSGSNKKKSTTLPNETVEYLKAWMMSPEHIAHPYPTELEKSKIMENTGLELKQLTNWFVNNRKRIWRKKMLEVEACLQGGKDKTSSSPPMIQQDGSVLSLANLTASSRSIVNNVASRTSKRRSSVVRSPSIELTTPLGSPIRIISEQNSVVSVSDGVISSDDDEASAQATEEPMVLQQESTTESVEVHILRSTSGSLPELSDVTVLQNIPSERILRTFESCALTYRYPDAKKAQSRRDAEIVRMKKHYLAVFFTETASPEAAAAIYNTDSTPTKKRKEPAHVITPRRKFRRVSVELWKEACQTADHVYDQALPSMEEASRLFGYSSWETKV